MANLPWRPNVGATDAQLDAAVAAHAEREAADRERRASEVNRLLSDAEVQTWRYAERRGRTYQFWGKGRYRGKRLTNITKMHTATAAVNQGSLNAHRTTLPEGDKDFKSGLPKRPSLAWLRTIDQNAATDQGRTETDEKRKRRGIAWAGSVDNTDRTIPSRRATIPPHQDPNRDDNDSD